jgi:hypothetical protein
MCKGITVVAWSKTRHFCALSNTGIGGSNPIRGMNVCVFLVFCSVHVAVMRGADPLSKASYQLSNL